MEPRNRPAPAPASAPAAAAAASSGRGEFQAAPLEMAPKKEKKKKSSKSRSKSGDGSASAKAPALRGSLDFEAGLLFERFDRQRTGALSRDEFQEMWREYAELRRRDGGGAGGAGGAPARPADGTTFAAGQLFQRYDSQSRGALSKADFERLMQDLSAAPAEGAGAVDHGGQGGRVGFAPPTAPARRPAAVDPASAAGVGARRYRASRETYTHFDETSGVPVPAERVNFHVETGHSVVPLMEAYSKRHARLCGLLTRRLMPRREQLMNVVRRTRSRMEEVRAARQAIERTTMADCETVLERLRSAEALKMATLTAQLSETQAELDDIDRVTEQVEGARSSGGAGPGLLDFADGRSAAAPEPLSTVDVIQMYPELCAAIDRLAAKPVAGVAEVRADDLPTETAERLEVVRRADRYEEALALKDAMLWELLREKEGADGERESGLERQRTLEAELANWLELSDRMAKEIADLRRRLQDQGALAEEARQLRHELAVLRARAAEAEARAADPGGRPPKAPFPAGHWIYPGGR